MFPEPTELLLIVCSIESIWTPRSKSNTLTPKTQLADVLTKGNFTRDEWNQLLCVFNISHFSSTNCLEVMSKRTQENEAKKVSQHNRSRWWIWSRDASSRKGSKRACLDCIGKPGENQIWKSDTFELVDWAAVKNGETCKGQLLIRLLRMEYWRKVVFSRVEIWWNVEHKYRKTCKWTTSRFVHLQHTDRFVIDDDDKDSNTAAKSGMSLKSRSFLHRVNDRVRKILDQSSKDAMQDSDKRSLIWWMFMSSTLEASVFRWKNYSEILHSI